MQMASRRFYAYYVRGSQLALVEHDAVSGDGQTLGQPSLDDIGPSGGLQWKSPTATIANGLEIEYTYSPTNAIVDETDTIDLPEYLAKGLVYYVKAKVAEDQGDIEQKEYFMREFRRILEKHESSKVRGPRVMIPGTHGIR
jgi:hypothetical protein